MHESPLIQRASLLLEQGRVKDAIKELNVLLQSEPDNAHALSIYARCYFKMKEFHKGIDTILHAIRADTGNSYYFYLLGFGYYRIDDHKGALEMLNRAVSMSPYSSEYYGMLSHVYIAEKDFNKALLKANEGLALDAENINCLNARSIALNKLKQTDAAIATMQNALAQDPENETTQTTVGWNLLEKGRHKEAAGHFREALRLGPGNEGAKSGLKEALKSKIPPYKWLLQYSFWLNNKGRKAARFFPVVIFVMVRIFAGLLRSNHSTMVLGSVVVGLYVLFVITSWIINPIANFFLLFTKDGRYALTKTEEWTAITVVSSIAAGVILVIISQVFVYNNIASIFLIAGLAFLCMSVPLGQIEYPLSWNHTGSKNKIGLVLVSLGLLTATLAFINETAAMVTGGIFIVLFVLNTWFGVFGKR